MASARAPIFGFRRTTLLTITMLAMVSAPAHGVGFFTEDFSNTGSLPGPNLEQAPGGSAATFDGSVTTFPGVGAAGEGRSYLRTVDDDYNTTSFMAEITLTLSGGSGAGAGFLGLGVGDPNAGAGSFHEPTTGSHVFMFAAPSDFSGGHVRLTDNGIDLSPPTSGAAGDGTHRLRMNYDASTQTVQFAIAQNHSGGLFIPTTVFSGIDTSDNGFDGTNARIFFGGSSNITYDDLSVSALSGMDALWTGATDSAYGTASNWSSAAVPAATDNLFFTDTASTFTVDLGGNRVANSVTFAGASNYTVNNNTLRLGAGNVTTTGSATHTINSDINLTAAGDWAIDADLNVVGVISGPVGINKTGSGTLTLSGANTYSGGTTLNGGTLLLASSSAAGTGAITVLGSTIDYADTTDIANNIDLQNNVTLNVSTAAAATQSGDISETGGSFGVTKTDAGTLTLSGDNTYTGDTTVDGGGLRIVGSVTGGGDAVVRGGGTLDIEDGGQVSSEFSTVGLGVVGTGAATVRGTDGLGNASTWTSSADLFVGGFVGLTGTGALNVEAGGQVSNTAGIIGTDSSSTGVVTVTGTDGSGNASTWANSADLLVGFLGNGTLNVEAGGQVSNLDASIGHLPGSTGVATVTGTDGSGNPSTWANSGSLNIGGNSDGTLNILTGGLVTVGQTTSVGQAGTMNLNGGRFEFGQTTLDEFRGFNATSGSLAGAVSIAGFNEVTAVPALLTSPTISPTVDISDVAVVNTGVLFGNGALAVDLAANAATGELEVIAGERMRLPGNNITNAGQINNFGGQVRFENDILNEAGGTVSGRGEFIADGGWTNQGAFQFSGGFSDILGDVSNEATGTIISSGAGTATFFDDVVNAGTMRASSGATIVVFGAFSGNGVEGPGLVNLEGTVSPGFSPGVMAFGGDLTFNDSASLLIEIDGPTPGSEHDQVTVAGDLTLNGQLNFASTSGAAGDEFTIITDANTINGTFDTVTGHDVGGDTGPVDLALAVFYDTDKVRALITVKGDADGSGATSLLDLNTLGRNFNQAGTWAQGDFNGDGIVSLLDLDQLSENFNQTAFTPAPASAPIPEPASLALLGLSGMLLVCRARPRGSATRS